jgi:hypothetical protein
LPKEWAPIVGMVLDDKAQTVLADLGAGSTKETY